MNLADSPRSRMGQAAVLTLALLAAFPALCPAADELLKFSAVKPIPLRLQVDWVKKTNKEEAKPSVLVQIKTPGIGEASIFPLQEPARIVIDLPANTAIATKNLTPRYNPWLAAVRIGSPPGKLRIVLELKSSAPTNFNIAKGSEALAIYILEAPAEPEKTSPPAGPGETTASTATATLEPSPSPSPTPLPPTASPTPAASTATPEPAVIAFTAAPTVRPLETVSPSITAITAETTYKQALTAIDFDNVHPAFRLVLKTRPQFKLTKKDEHSYTLTISECSIIADHLKLPYFPPQNLVGFTHILARENPGGIEVTIGVERGIRISAVAKDSAIVVRSLTR